MNNYKKHWILIYLRQHWDKGEEKTTTGYEITDLGRSLTIIQIQKLLSGDISKNQKLCDSLVTDGYLKLFRYDKDNKSHRYIITDKGKTAVTDKTFLNKMWFMNINFWFKLFTFIIALLGLLNSIFGFIEK